MIFNLFFLFSNVETTKYQIKDLFDVRQGKLVLHNDANIKKADGKLSKNEELNTTSVLTLHSVNWELSTIRVESLFNIPTPKTIPPPLTNNDFIINRVGQTKGCSLLQSDFDFNNNPVIPSHHFVVCSPRKIILDKLPFFHAVLEIFLSELVSSKLKTPENEAAVKTTKQKLTYVTVKQIQNIEVELPSENFDMIVSQFDQYYNMYAASYKNYISATTNLNSHKIELSKFLKKEFDWNK
jgi:hypothetical protein